MKYLNELYLPYCSYLETNILLTSISSILNIFLFLLLSKFMLFPFILILCKEKKINNLGIRVMIIYFCFVLIDLINDYKNHKKNVYSRNNKVTLQESICYLKLTGKI